MGFRWYIRKKIKKNLSRSTTSRFIKFHNRKTKTSNRSKTSTHSRTVQTLWTTSIRTTSTPQTSTIFQAKISVKRCIHSNLTTTIQFKNIPRQNCKSKKFWNRAEKKLWTNMEWYLNSSRYQRSTKYTLLLHRPIWKIAYCTKNKHWKYHKWLISQQRTMRRSSRRICLSYNLSLWISIRIRPKTHLASSIPLWPKCRIII